jgi:hypothetical protein
LDRYETHTIDLMIKISKSPTQIKYCIEIDLGLVLFDHTNTLIYPIKQLPQNNGSCLCNLITFVKRQISKFN